MASIVILLGISMVAESRNLFAADTQADKNQQTPSSVSDCRSPSHICYCKTSKYICCKSNEKCVCSSDAVPLCR